MTDTLLPARARQAQFEVRISTRDPVGAQELGVFLQHLDLFCFSRVGSDRKLVVLAIRTGSIIVTLGMATVGIAGVLGAMAGANTLFEFVEHIRRTIDRIAPDFAPVEEDPQQLDEADVALVQAVRLILQRGGSVTFEATDGLRRSQVPVTYAIMPMIEAALLRGHIVFNGETEIIPFVEGDDVHVLLPDLAWQRHPVDRPGLARQLREPVLATETFGDLVDWRRSMGRRVTAYVSIRRNGDLSTEATVSFGDQRDGIRKDWGDPSLGSGIGAI